MHNQKCANKSKAKSSIIFGKKTRRLHGAAAGPNSGFTIIKNLSEFIQIPPTIFHPTLGNNYWLQMTELGFAG
jgi:hypothetical protein